MGIYIDAEKLYADTVKWESEALTVLATLNPYTDYKKYAKWSVILNERTSFKYDIMDAPKADVEEVRHGYWVQPNPSNKPFCSECKTFEQTGVKKNYCSECGAKMDKEVLNAKLGNL